MKVSCYFQIWNYVYFYIFFRMAKAERIYTRSPCLKKWGVMAPLLFLRQVIVCSASSSSNRSNPSTLYDPAFVLNAARLLSAKNTAAINANLNCVSEIRHAIFSICFIASSIVHDGSIIARVA